MLYKCLLFSFIFCHLLILSVSLVSDDVYFTINPQDQLQVVEGAETQLHCDVNDRTDVIFTWYINDKLIKNTERRYQEGRKLIFKSVSRELDKGWFHCQAQSRITLFGAQSTSAAAEPALGWLCLATAPPLAYQALNSLG